MNLRFPRVLMLCSCEPPDSLFPNFAHYPAQSTPSLFLECRALFILASSAPSRVNSICSALTGLAPALANWPFAACRTHFLMSDSASPELWLSPRMIDALNQSHRFQFVYLWWVWLDSNQRPRDYETQPFNILYLLNNHLQRLPHIKSLSHSPKLGNSQIGVAQI